MLLRREQNHAMHLLLHDVSLTPARAADLVIVLLSIDPAAITPTRVHNMRKAIDRGTAIMEAALSGAHSAHEAPPWLACHDQAQ